MEEVSRASKSGPQVQRAAADWGLTDRSGLIQTEREIDCRAAVVAAKVASLEMLAIEETISSLDFKALERVVAALGKVQRILLFALWEPNR